ncbi:MAG: hypothetical protein GY832_03145 [Chloroflexi bacterium]|nr:hypothetical protein [Chloroflexota bacterium]
MSKSRFERLSFVLLLGVYLVLAVSYSLSNPLYESTDELAHFRYVRHIATYYELPVQQRHVPRAQSHHPPLYYTLGALACGWVPVTQDVYYAPVENSFWGYRQWEVGNDNKNQYLHGDDERFPFYGITLAVYLVRWMTVIIGAGVVWMTYRTGCEIFPQRPALALGGAALVAFNPQFLYLSGAVNNDILTTLCGAAVLWACVRMVQNGPSICIDVTLGILLGLALLTKFSLLALMPLVALAYLLAVRPLRWRALLQSALTVLTLMLLLSGWWFWRNHVLYGDFTGMSQVNQLWAGRKASENWWAIRQSLPYLWSSLWGRFGYGQVPLPQPVYQGILAFCILALTGYLLPRRGRDRFPRDGALILLSFIIVFVTVVFYYILIQPAGAMGRFLFPALSAFALLLSAGLDRLFAFISPRRSAWIVSVGMVALAIYVLVGTLIPAFARPRLLPDAAIATIPNATDVEFGLAIGTGHSGVVRVLGYQISPRTVTPGGIVEVTVYWQTLAQIDQNYVVFIHLLSEVGTMAAQRDTHPGLGRYPTTTWEPGVIFADTYRLHIPEVAYTSDNCYVQIGLYLPDGPRLTIPDGDASLPFEENGRDALRLADVEIQPRPGEFPNPINANFDDQAALVGYTLEPRVARPGKTIRLTLYWRASAPIETDYRIFAQVLGVENQTWANSDILPTIPTSQWQPGQVVEDVHDLDIGLTTPPDFYDIVVGVNDPGVRRLSIITEDGSRLGKHILLSKIRVVGDE